MDNNLSEQSNKMNEESNPSISRKGPEVPPSDEQKMQVVDEDREYDLDIACTGCGHMLDHYAYKICSHPFIPVPLCQLCYDDVREKLKDTSVNTEDRCSWCGQDDSGELYVCGDGSTCKHNFCDDCLRQNLGPNFVENLQSSEDDWTCLVCAPEQVKLLQETMELGMKKSIYSDSYGVDGVAIRMRTGDEVHDADKGNDAMSEHHSTRNSSSSSSSSSADADNDGAQLIPDYAKEVEIDYTRFKCIVREQVVAAEMLEGMNN